MEGFSSPFAVGLASAMNTAVTQSLRVQPGERVLIVTNPEVEVSDLAIALFTAVLAAGGRPNLIWQPVKTQLDSMDEVVRAALLTEPEVFVSLSANKLGKDPVGKPYQGDNGTAYESLTSFLIHGKKVCRGFWSPGVTREGFVLAVGVDYARLKADCAWLVQAFTGAAAVRVTAPGGTEVTFRCAGRQIFVDDGDFSRPGSGGNLPAGESYLSPVVGTAQGRIVFDGSMSTNEGTLILSKPIVTEWEAGFLTQLSGGREAEALADTLRGGEDLADSLVREGRLSAERGAEYRKNCRGLGELGVGVNPKASILGSMLIDEKAGRTCHFAIGRNYDNDAPAPIHLDGVVKEPTIEVERTDGTVVTIVEDGELCRTSL